MKQMRNGWRAAKRMLLNRRGQGVRTRRLWLSGAMGILRAQDANILDSRSPMASNGQWQLSQTKQVREVLEMITKAR